MLKRFSMSREKCKKHQAERALDAFNTLALALTDHDHKWTKGDRKAYGLVSRWIISFCDGDLAA
jgi:hypothetical protein